MRLPRRQHAPETSTAHPRRPGPALLAERLRRASSKLTGPRRAILDVLGRQAHPVSTREIFAALPPGGGDLATVYRAMRLLEAMGMVKRYDLGDGVARFELVAEGDAGHHHHLVCTRCAAVVEVAECFPSELEDALASQHHFSAVTHRLEFFGICPDCQRR